MSKIAAIRYIDAFYFLEGEGLRYAKFKIQVAIGRIAVRGDCIVVAFSERNGAPYHGVFMSKRALILDDRSASVEPSIRKLSLKDIGFNAGIFWEDIVYFENGKVPIRPTAMYTEGKIFKITSDAIVIRDPETIKIKNKSVKHHPEYPDGKLAFFIIPRSFITSIEFYGKEI